MSQEGSGRTARSALRVAAAVVAGISAVLAVVLVVFADASTAHRLGTILALWTVVIGSFAVIKVRDADAEKAIASGARSEELAQQAVAQLAAMREETARLGLDAGREAAELGAMSERVALEVRRSVDLERQAAAAQQREFLMQLESMLRRQLESTMERELSAMRDEVSALRAEVLDQLGGQLRLERIETTRLIGSDVEALQREVSQLASMRKALQVTLDHDDLTDLAAAEITRPPDALPTPTLVEAAPIDIAPSDTARREAPSEAVLIEAVPTDTVPSDTAPVEAVPSDTVPADTVPSDTVPSDTVPAGTVPADTVPVEAAVVEAVPTDAVPAASQPDAEPAINRRLAPLFADLPSLSHFQDAPSSAPRERGADRAAQDDAYSGRRRRPAANEPAVTEPAATQPAATQASATQPAATQPAATQASATEPAATQAAASEAASADAEQQSAGGRRRRSDDQASDVLSRLLGR